MLYELQNVLKTRSREDNYRLCIRRLQVFPGECLAITGPSGCGKSTALDILGMALKPDSADSFMFCPDGHTHDVGEKWRHDAVDEMGNLRRQFLGYVLQTGELLPFLTVFENIELPARLAGTAEHEAQTIAVQMMEMLHILPLRNALPATLSVGERQRVAICRALASKPKIILADEPTAALDPLLARTVMRLLLENVHKTGAALILVSHDIGLVGEFGIREVPIALEQTSEGVLAVLNDSRTGGVQ